MDMLTTVFQGLAGAVVSKAGVTVYNILVEKVKAWSKDQTEAKLLQTLRDLGSLSDADVRKRAEQFARQEQLTDAQCDELTTLLLKLVHGSRFHTTHGTPCSGYVRCKDLVQQLLDRLLPLKRAGTPVAVGHMDWRLVRFLGMGAFGEVWLAENRHFHPKERAYKFFTRPDGSQWLSGEQQNLRYIRKQLEDHPNIVEFLDVSFGAQPHPFLALEYVGGGSLEDWLLKKDKTDRPTLNKLEVIRGVARGLARAHKKGICHRDLKPANILLTEGPTDVQAKITDFGLGRVTNDEQSQEVQPLLVGTTLYLPPEAAEPFRERAPAQDDVFTLGVIWYQLLVERVERPPYDFAAQLRREAVDTQTIRLIERCLARPDDRFKDGCELYDELEALPPDTWEVPEDGFDVRHLAREYLATRKV
jgi:serine/threonine protein kinase